MAAGNTRPAIPATMMMYPVALKPRHSCIARPNP